MGFPGICGVMSDGVARFVRIAQQPASIAAALYHCEIDPRRLAGDRRAPRLMCRAITDGVAALTREVLALVARDGRLESLLGLLAP